MSINKNPDADTMEVTVTPELIRGWATGTSDPRPLETGQQTYLPPASLFHLALIFRRDNKIRSNSRGDDAVQSQYRMTTHRPIRVGDRLTIKGQIICHYTKREREYSVWNFRFIDESGEEVACYMQEGLETYAKAGEK